MEIPSLDFYVKVGVSLAALQELKCDKNYTALGKLSFDKLDFIEKFLTEVAEATYLDDDENDPS